MDAKGDKAIKAATAMRRQRTKKFISFTWLLLVDPLETELRRKAIFFELAHACRSSEVSAERFVVQIDRFHKD